jgi:hypothetical protein
MSKNNAAAFFKRCIEDAAFRGGLNSRKEGESFQAFLKNAGYDFTHAEGMGTLNDFICYAATEDEQEAYNGLLSWYMMQTAADKNPSAVCLSCSLRNQCTGS